MFKELSHKTFLVGGAVRNEILGIKVKDFDYVIEDTTEEELLSVFPEAKKVGNDFPVYLINGHEVALTRTEKSTGNGYTDFIFEAGVSIHEDLSRRDLTINSIAQNYKTNEYVDPHNGIQDIENRVIRTINPNAFEDDPLRIYRAIRFAAEFDFNIEEDTFKLMKASKDRLKHMTMERVALELEKVYQRSEKPSRFFKILLELDALQIHFKPLYLMSKISSGPNKFHHGRTALEHVLDSFDYAKAQNYSYDIALAALFHDTGKGVSKKVTEGDQHHYGHELMSYAINKKFVEQHRFTSKQNELIILFARHHMYFHLLTKVKNPIKLIRFFRKIKRYVTEMILAANTDHPLSEEQITILINLDRTIKETEIEIPVSIIKKSIPKSRNDAITEYVNNQYAQKYKELSNV